MRNVKEVKTAKIWSNLADDKTDLVKCLQNFYSVSPRVPASSIFSPAGRANNQSNQTLELETMS